MIDIVDTYSWSDFHKEGDVILVFSGGIGSQLNTRIQSLLRGHKAHFSHVMLCVAPGLYAHSITKRGVTYELAEQYPISTIATNFKVFRHRHLCKDLNSFAKITTAAAYHAKKGYNWLLIIPLLRQYFQRTVFCSEFVCRVFSSLDPQYHLTPNPLFTLPVDIEKNIADNSDNWNDVTGAYIEADNAYAANPQNLHEFYDSRKLFFYLLKMTIEQVNSHIDFLNEWASLDNALKHLLRTKSPKKIIKLIGIQEPPSKTHYCISLYRAAIDYYKEDLLTKTMFKAAYETLIWYAPTQEQVSRIFSSLDETHENLRAKTYTRIKEAIRTEGRILSTMLSTIGTCSEWLSNTACDLGDDKHDSRKLLIEGTLKEQIGIWLKEAESEGYRPAVLSIIEELQKTFRCHEPDVSVPSMMTEIYAQCEVKESLSDDLILELLKCLSANKLTAPQLKALYELVSAARGYLSVANPHSDNGSIPRSA